MFDGVVEYQHYDEIIERIEQFEEHEIIGQDSTGDNDIYLIELGNPDNPTIFITASVHGNEWQSTVYSMAAMEMLRDDNYPYQRTRDILMNYFHIVYIPVVNPSGLIKAWSNGIYQSSDRDSRRNDNYVDLNRNFESQSEIETQIVVEQAEKFKPFSYIDLHLFPPGYSYAEGEKIIIHTQTEEMFIYKEQMAADLEETLNENVKRWYTDPWEGTAANFFRALDNDYTPYTLSILSELERPAYDGGQIVENIRPEDMYLYGNEFIRSFFDSSINYFYSHNLAPWLNYNQTIQRDNDGLAYQAIENRDGDLFVDYITRDSIGFVESIYRIKKDK